MAKILLWARMIFLLFLRRDRLPTPRRLPTFFRLKVELAKGLNFVGQVGFYGLRQLHFTGITVLCSLANSSQTYNHYGKHRYWFEYGSSANLAQIV